MLALRAVGVSITYKMQLHPNSRCLLDHIVELFVDEHFVRRAKAMRETVNLGDEAAKGARRDLVTYVVRLDYPIRSYESLSFCIQSFPEANRTDPLAVLARSKQRQRAR